MFHDQQSIEPRVRTFEIEQVKKRILMSSDTNEVSSENDDFEEYLRQKKKFLSYHSTRRPIETIPSLLQKIIKIIQQPVLLSRTQKMINTMDDHSKPLETFYHEQYLSSSTVLLEKQQTSSISFVKHQQSSSTDLPSTNKADTLSSVIRVERPPLSQLMPDSIINDKQATKRIFNVQTSTHFLRPSELVTLTPMNSLLRQTSEAIDSDKSVNHARFYQIASIFTSTSSLIMHPNEIIAHSAASDPFLSDTIFIIIIATLTIIILLFCFGLFCLCRRTTQRNISPSFDGGGSYAGLNGQSFTIPIDDHYPQEERISKYENNRLSSSPQIINEKILLPQSVALHHTAKQKVQLSKNKLKKKRAGFCCCSSKDTTSPIVHTRTRIKTNPL